MLDSSTTSKISLVKKLLKLKRISTFWPSRMTSLSTDTLQINTSLALSTQRMSEAKSMEKPSEKVSRKLKGVEKKDW